jgi:DNA-binding NtrC family response regulator
MDKNSGDIPNAAKDLGLTAKTLERKLKRISGAASDDPFETAEDA